MVILLPLASTTQGDDELDKYILGVERGLGAGVTLTGQLLYVDYSDETTNDSNNNNGWALVGGVRLPSKQNNLSRIWGAVLPLPFSLSGRISRTIGLKINQINPAGIFGP